MKPKRKTALKKEIKEILHFKRVLYGKSDTPKKLREFKLRDLNPSPVGTINEWKKWAKKQGFTRTKLKFEDLK